MPADDEQLARTSIAARTLRLIFHCPGRARVEAHLYRWQTYCADADIPELTRLAATIQGTLIRATLIRPESASR